MKQLRGSRSNADAPAPSLWPLFFCGGVLCLVCWQISNLSAAFGLEHPQLVRPLLRVLMCFGFAFFIHLFALAYAFRIRSSYLTPTIVGFAILFRAILVFSTPIQEIDIYRYIWDGHVSLAGVSPFEFAPAEVLQAGLEYEDSGLDEKESEVPPVLMLSEASSPEPSSPGPVTNAVEPELLALVEKSNSSPGLHEVLSRIHFGQLPTVYPPVSQFVFSIAAWSTPDDAALCVHLVVMKAWILLFDIGTICFIAMTLARANFHAAWLIAYAWCPLVLKEFANSGHLDSIAVFFSVASIYFFVRAFFARTEVMVDYRLPYANLLEAVVGSVLLALAVGAKLYPVALLPVLALSSWKLLGSRRTLVIGAVFAFVTLFCLAPMFQASDRVTSEQVQSDRQAGLKAFLSKWMMNDFIFLNLIENATPDQFRAEGDSAPWFVFVPNTVRTSVIDLVAGITGVEKQEAPFRLARITTAMIFAALSVWFGLKATNFSTPADWLEYVFLTMVWFWLLLPTLNPWYLIWALPWLPFCKNRMWISLSGIVFIYYLRFHFGAHYADERVVWLFDAKGEAFFDYVVVWLEYVPWFVCLVVFNLRDRLGSVSNDR